MVLPAQKGRSVTPEVSRYIRAARVPNRLKPQAFGLWSIRRVTIKDNPQASEWDKLGFKVAVGFDSQTLLHRWSMKSLHLNRGEIVMEDSRTELQKHLPIWLNAFGRVLVTGLGLGCVVRGLLANPQVEHITVVEIDRSILRVVGHEFAFNRRVEMIHGDALKVDLRRPFEFAWHDLWTDGDEHLQVLHTKLLVRFEPWCGFQGAWNLPRYAKKMMPPWVLR